MSQTAIYLASSPKSNASYMAIKSAQEEVRKSGHTPIPLHLRNAPTNLMKEIGYGKEYQYAHDFDNNFVDIEYMPDPLVGSQFYIPGKNANENKISERLAKLWKGKYGF